VVRIADASSVVTSWCDSIFRIFGKCGCEELAEKEAR